MNAKLKRILKIIILILVIYLLISAIYIAIHVNFGTEPTTVGMGFSSSTNLLRTFMGLPRTNSTYEGVSPIYLIQSVVKIIIAIALLIFYSKINEKFKKKFITIISIIIVAIIALIIGVKLLTSNNSSFEQKANEIFGSIYCDENHWTMAGDALTSWTCKLCGLSDINPDTDVPVICNTCANLTGRCQKCGKLEK